MHAREVVTEYDFSIKCESQFASVEDKKVNDEQVYKESTDEYNLRYEGNLRVTPCSRSKER